MRIYYRKGYKYQLDQGFGMRTDIIPIDILETKYILLYRSGRLIIKMGYAWDGPSGPAVDTKSFMRASLVHDALYQLFRQGLLPLIWRKEVDKLLYQLCLEDGMWRWRAWLAYRAVRRFAKKAALPSQKKEVLEAGK